MARPFFHRAAAAVFLLALLIALPTPGAAQEGAFVPGIEDLPMMPGLTGDRDDGMVFDTPAGRIVEAYASGPVAWPDVLAFYEETLPQLGWSSGGEGLFRREGEVLRLEVLRGEAEASTYSQTPTLTVRFTLSPGDGTRNR
jgi:hypothetical protein